MSSCLTYQTRASFARATLDLEPRRLILLAPSPPSSTAPGPSYLFDLDLSQPDVSIEALFTSAVSLHENDRATCTEQTLALKHERALDVDGARAEWRIAEGVLVIYA